MRYTWLFEWLEQNDIPLGLFTMFLVVLLLCFICILITRKVGSKPMVVGRCKDCIYFREDYTRTYGCTDYVWLPFPWSKKEGPCPVEERWNLLAEDKRLAQGLNPGIIILNEIAVQQDSPPLTAYETRKKEIEENSEPIEGIFYIRDGRIIPDYYSECLFSDENNPLRAVMYHHEFYPNYMRRRFTDLVRSDEKSVPRGRIAGTLSDPVIYIDKCYKHDVDVLNRVKELYHLPNTVVMPNKDYSCPDCYNKK